MTAEARVADLLVELDDETIVRLHRRAAMNGRSVEAEHMAILQEALPPTEDVSGTGRSDLEALKRDLARLRAETAGRGGPTGAELIREDRDSR